MMSVAKQCFLMVNICKCCTNGNEMNYNLTEKGD